MSAIGVARELEIRADADLARRVVDVGQGHGNARCEGDPVEARFPVVGTAARTLGRQRQAEFPPDGKLPFDLLDKAARLTAVHRDPTPADEERRKRPAGQRVLADEADRDADHRLGEEADDRVPVRRVRIEDDDAPLRHGTRQADRPADGAQGPCSETREQPRHSRAVDDGSGREAGQLGGQGEGRKRREAGESICSLANVPSPSRGRR